MLIKNAYTRIHTYKLHLEISFETCSRYKKNATGLQPRWTLTHHALYRSRLSLLPWAAYGELKQCQGFCFPRGGSSLTPRSPMLRVFGLPQTIVAALQSRQEVLPLAHATELVVLIAADAAHGNVCRGTLPGPVEPDCHMRQFGALARASPACWRCFLPDPGSTSDSEDSQLQRDRKTIVLWSLCSSCLLALLPARPRKHERQRGLAALAGPKKHIS